MKHFNEICCIQQETTSGIDSSFGGFSFKEKFGLVFLAMTVPLGLFVSILFFLIHQHPTINNAPIKITIKTTGTTMGATLFFFSFRSYKTNVVAGIGVVEVKRVGVSVQHFPLYPQNFLWSGRNVLLQYLTHHSQPKRLLQSSELLKQEN